MLNKTKYISSILVAAFCFGLIPIFGQFLTNNSVSSFKQTFFMEMFAFILIFPLYFFFLKVQRIKIKDSLFFLLFGGSLFLVNLMPLTAIALGMPVALVSLLLYVYPAFTLVLGKIWFGDEITIKKILYVIIALLGVACVLGGGFLSGVISLQGILVALGGGISLAFWACFGRASSIKGYKPFDSLFWSEVGAVLMLIVSIFIFPKLFPQPMVGGFDFYLNPTIIGWLVALAIICVVIGHSLFFYGVEKIKPFQASIIALFEPITAVVLSAIIFGQTLSWWTLVGGVLIFVSSILLNSTE